jgi:hypothetical protein
MNAPKLKLVSETREQCIESLEPGELLVRIVRDGMTIPPDQAAIAKANRALRNWTVYANPDRDSERSA